MEALEDALLKIDVGDEVALRVIHRGVGAITQNDVNLATVDNAIILGFNVKFAERVEEYAEREGVDVRFYSVIYQAIDDVEAALKGMLKPEYEEVQLGTAEVREIFRSSRFGNIAGALVRSGVIRRNAKARVLRGGRVIADNLAIESLKRFKDDATEVREGYECGIGLGSFNDIAVDDVIETYEMREKPRDRSRGPTGRKDSGRGGPPAGDQARRTHPGDRRAHARHPRQGPAPRVRDGDRRARDRRPPARLGLLHRAR